MAHQIPSLDSLLQVAANAFQKHFGSLPDVAGCAPGRVNIMGDHSDYNDGLVLPIAVAMVTIFVGKKNGSTICSIVTLSNHVDTPRKIDISLEQKISQGKPKWANYVKGVLALFPGKIPGFDAVIVSSIPLGRGLGSSAALTVSAYTFLEDLSGKKTEKLTQKALTCRKAKSDYAGVPSGIMDLFIPIFGKKGCVLFLDCRSMEKKAIPVPKDKIKLIVAYTNVKHVVDSDEYHFRKKLYETAVKLLSKKSLRDATEDDLRDLRDDGIDNEIIKRARHVIGENMRTQVAAKALETGDFKELGNVMIASHNSLRDNFQVSSKDLDTLVQFSLDVEGVHGSRMQGVGFGDCVITLVQANAAQSAIKHMNKKFEGQATFYVLTFMDGCMSLSSKLQDSKIMGKISDPKIKTNGEVQESKSKTESLVEQESNRKNTKEVKPQGLKPTATKGSKTILSEHDQKPIPLKAVPANEAKSIPSKAVPAKGTKSPPLQEIPANDPKSIPSKAVPANDQKSKPSKAVSAHSLKSLPSKTTVSKSVTTKSISPKELSRSDPKPTSTKTLRANDSKQKVTQK